MCAEVKNSSIYAPSWH